MNYCTKCLSYYQKPGTCNCYAQTAQPTDAPTLVPYIIPPTVAPYWPYPLYPWRVTTTPVITWGPGTITTDAPITVGNDIRIVGNRCSTDEIQ